MKSSITFLTFLLLSVNSFASALHHPDQIGQTLFTSYESKDKTTFRAIFLTCSSDYEVIEECSSFTYRFRVVDKDKNTNQYSNLFERQGDIPLTNLSDLQQEIKEYVELNKIKRDHSYEVSQLEKEYEDYYKYGRGNKEGLIDKLMFNLMKHPTVLIDRHREGPLRDYKTKLESDFLMFLTNTEFRGSTFELDKFQDDFYPINHIYDEIKEYSEDNL